MHIHLLAVGERPPGWVHEGFREYAQRLPMHCRLVLREIPAGRRTKGADIAKLVREEGERLLAAVPKGALIVALDRLGQPVTTEELASKLKKQMELGQDMALLVGGPEGLPPECLARAQAKWSLSMMTFAHPLVRVMVAEQFYRAWSILNNLPYHRGGG